MSSLASIQPLVRLPFAGVLLPEITITPDLQLAAGAPAGCSNAEFLRQLCRQGWKKRLAHLPKDRYPEYAARVKMELETIEELGFTRYILAVWDMCRFADEQGIPRGPGRGCLHGDSRVLIDGRYIPIKDAVLGTTINSDGLMDQICDTLRYECQEDLIELDTYYGVPMNPAFTKDHKLLCLRNPFGERDSIKCGVRGFASKLDRFDTSRLEWCAAQDVRPDDYLIRYTGRRKPVKNIEVIDLALFSKYFDDQYVYDKDARNKSCDLCMKTIRDRTGLSFNYLISVKENRPVRWRISRQFNRLTQYLQSIGKTLEDFRLFDSTVVSKIPRFLKVDEDFCYILGFFLGDGWWRGYCVGFAFHSVNNLDQLQRIENFFLGYRTYKNVSKTKKLVQLMVNSHVIARLFKSLVPDKGSGKVIPEEFLDLPDHKLRALMMGLQESDGHSKIDKDNSYRVSFDNTSERLIYQYRWIAEYFGYPCGIIVREQKGCQRSYKVRYNIRQKPTSTGYWNGKYLFVKVRNIQTKKGDGFVYDLTVKDNPSYHTDGFIVHNSVAGSLVSHLTNMTQLDPVQNGLFFSRFLSKARAKKVIVDGVSYIDGSLVPDIDCDFSYYRRGEIIEYLGRRYPGQTSKLLTTTTFTSKILIKDVLKVYENATEDQANAASDLIEKKHGNPVELEDGLHGDLVWRQSGGQKGDAPNEKLVEWAADHEEVMDIAMALSGLNRGEGQHASAVLICHEKIADLMPLQLSSEKELTSGFDMYSAQEIIIKMDILGLRTLDVIHEACRAIGITPDSIDVHHPSIYAYLQDFRNRYGVFQLETFAQGNAAAKVKPKDFEQLSAVLAIARPGAFSFIQQYCDYIHDGVYKSVHPLIDDILKDTAGICLFQETYLAMLIRVGMTAEWAENARRVLGKKKVEEVPAVKAEIEEVCRANGHPLEITDLLLKIAEDSGGYSFNRCLSPSTVVQTPDGGKRLYHVKPGDQVLAYDVAKKVQHMVKVVAVHGSHQRLFDVRFGDTDIELTCSAYHKLLCEDGVMRPLWDILPLSLQVVTEYGLQPVMSVSVAGPGDTLDLEVDHPDHNFYAEGVVVSNSHSSSYAIISAQTLYLKANHPIHFYWALLRMARHESNAHEVIAQIEREMRGCGFKLLPPDLIKSQREFTIESPTSIRYGLSLIRGVSDKTVEKLDALRITAATTDGEGTPNKFRVFQSIKNAGLNIGMGSALIQAGCFDGCGGSRCRVVLELLTWNLLTDREKGVCLSIGSKPEVNWDVLNAIVYLRDHTDDAGKPLFSRKTRFDTIKRKYEAYKVIYDLNRRNEQLCNYWYERTVLGYSFSHTIRDIFAKETDGLVSIKEAKDLGAGEHVRLIGFVKEPFRSKTKAGNDGFKLTLVDETDEITVRFFNHKIEACERVNGRLPIEGDLILADCEMKDGGDCAFADRIGIQTSVIYMKLSQLRDESEKRVAAEAAQPL